jgi:hypothetical protein
MLLATLLLLPCCGDGRDGGDFTEAWGLPIYNPSGGEGRLSTPSPTGQC